MGLSACWLPCRAVPFRAVPCRSVPCRAMPYHAVPCPGDEVGKAGALPLIVHGMVACLDDYQVQVQATRCMAVLVAASGA